MARSLAQVRPAGPEPDHGYLDAVGGSLLRHGVDVFPVPVGNEPLQTADGHRLTLDAPDALALALGLLGTHTAGKSRQGVGGGDDFVSGLEIPLTNLGDELRDAHVDRAALHALGVLAVQAAASFLNGHFLGIAQGDFLEIPGTNQRFLLGHGNFLQRHISHFPVPPYLMRALPMASMRQT